MREALAHRRVELQFDTSGTDIFGIEVPSFDRLESRRGTVERVLLYIHSTDIARFFECAAKQLLPWPWGGASGGTTFRAGTLFQRRPQGPEMHLVSALANKLILNETTKT